MHRAGQAGLIGAPRTSREVGDRTALTRAPLATIASGTPEALGPPGTPFAEAVHQRASGALSSAASAPPSRSLHRLWTGLPDGKVLAPDNVATTRIIGQCVIYAGICSKDGSVCGCVSPTLPAQATTRAITRRGRTRPRWCRRTRSAAAARPMMQSPPGRSPSKTPRETPPRPAHARCARGVFQSLIICLHRLLCIPNVCKPLNAILMDIKLARLQI